MRNILLGRRVLWTGTLALLVPASYGFAQDGQPPVGPPVTAPEVDRNAGGDPAEAVRPPKAASPDEVLTPVAETPSDPAPFGTRGVPAIGPRATTGRGVVPARTARGARLNRQIGANVVYAEGVVTRVRKPGPGAKNSRLMVTIDTTRNWQDHLTANLPGALPADEVAAEEAATAPGPKTIRAEGVDAPRIPALDDGGSTEDASGDRVVPLVITTRTHLYKFGRTNEGVDRYGLAMYDSPDVTADTPAGAVVATRRPARNAGMVDLAGIRPGAYVSVRYRRAGDTNEALNLSLIEASPETSTEGVAPTGGVVEGGTVNDPDAIFDHKPRVPRVPTSPSGNANTLPR